MLGPANTYILRGTQWTYATKTWGLQPTIRQFHMHPGVGGLF